MASLVLSAAGTALGGPAGGAVGALIGRQINRSFARPAIDRVNDLRFPSSQYGDPIPRIVGQMRVAGVVLWSSKPVATATVSKSGSAQGVSVSFALGLSSGRVQQIGRIWADGQLIRDGEGSQDVPFDLRLHGGDEDQLSDPLIASTLGDDLAPAFRGIAYLLFEDFDLSGFGNRLPMLMVEVTTSTDRMSAESVLSEGLGLSVADQQPGHELKGYALAGDDMKAALAPLVAALQPAFAYDGGTWRLGTGPARHVVERHLWTLTSKRGTIADGQNADLPTKVSVRYFNAAREFAASEKSARLPGRERLKRIELPAVLTSDVAKAFAFERLSDAVQDGMLVWLDLPLGYGTINVGDLVASESDPASPYRVCAKRLKDGSLSLQLRPERARVHLNSSDPEAVASASVLGRRPLRLGLVELPGLQNSSEMEVAVLVCGGHEPFRPLPVQVSDGGVQREIASAARPAPQGTLRAALNGGVRDLIDHRQSISVDFEQDPMLVSVDDAALLEGANLLLVDGEYIRFSTAEAMGQGSYKLSGLIRGCFDSDASADHAIGSSVYLIDPDAYCTYRVPLDRLGATVAAHVIGPDQATADTTLTVRGLSQRPWAPDHIEALDLQDGLQISWVRRAKSGLAWLDGVDVPLGASREAYVLSIFDQQGSRLEFEVGAPTLLIGTGSLAALGARPWRIEVSQLGDVARGNVGTHIIV